MRTNENKWEDFLKQSLHLEPVGHCTPPALTHHCAHFPKTWKNFCLFKNFPKIWKKNFSLFKNFPMTWKKNFCLFNNFPKTWKKTFGFSKTFPRFFVQARVFAVFSSVRRDRIREPHRSYVCFGLMQIQPCTVTPRTRDVKIDSWALLLSYWSTSH